MIRGILLCSLDIASTLTYYNEMKDNFFCPSDFIFNNKYDPRPDIFCLCS